jgi:hypothetical protein
MDVSGGDGEGDGTTTSDEKLKAERKAQVQSLEARLGTVRRARKCLEDADDQAFAKVLLEHHAAAEQDLEKQLREARALYQELRPTELKLEQAKKDQVLTQAKLDTTVQELAQVEEDFAKLLAKKNRLLEQQEQQKAKLARLDASIKEFHARMGGTTGGAPKDGQTSQDPEVPLADISSHPDHLKLLQQLEEAQAALAAARKRDRSDDDEAATGSPAKQRLQA